jgi:hypothetical protein
MDWQWKETARAVISWEPISDRVITVRLQARYSKVTLIQVYVPTNAASDQDKDKFYEQLQNVLDATPEHDMKLIMGDVNAQIGTDNDSCEKVMGKNAIGDRNGNGERLLSFCSSNKLKVGSSLFSHKTIHKGTWRSPDGRTVNQIDHICISQRWGVIHTGLVCSPRGRCRIRSPPHHYSHESQAEKPCKEGCQ